MKGTNNGSSSAIDLHKRTASKEDDRRSLREERKEKVSSALSTMNNNAEKALELSARRTIAIEKQSASASSLFDKFLMLHMMKTFGMDAIRQVDAMMANGAEPAVAPAAAPPLLHRQRPDVPNND